MWQNATHPLPGGSKPLRNPPNPPKTAGPGWHGICAFGEAVGTWGWAWAVGAEMENDAGKPQVGKTEVAVTTLNRLLSYLRPVILVGTILVLCLAIYVVSVALTKR